MIERILIFIKHRISILWYIIEWGNWILFSLVFRSKLENVLSGVFNEFTVPPFSYRRLVLSDTGSLHDLIRSQNDSDLEYFHPHSFDLASIRKQLNKSSFLMMGVFHQDEIVGYFFLRFFINKKCFVGRFIDKPYRGKGIGPVMNVIMYETAWRMGFRCLSTISRNNTAVMRAHARNRKLIVLKDLQNDYLLVEFIREYQSSGNTGFK